MSDLATVSRVYNISNGFAYKVYYEQVEVKLREYKSRDAWPEVVGIDEHFFRRKNRITEFVTVFTDVKNRKMFDMVHGKDFNSLTSQIWLYNKIGGIQVLS
jgi:hypothetical protein